MVLMDDASKPGFIISSALNSRLPGAGSCCGRYCEILCGTAPPPFKSLLQPPTNLSIPSSYVVSISGVVHLTIFVVMTMWSGCENVKLSLCLGTASLRHVRNGGKAPRILNLDTRSRWRDDSKVKWTLFIKGATVTSRLSNIKLKV
jgi:hypothetical protein